MSQPLAAARTAAGPAAELVLTRDLDRPARLTVPDLLAWPRHRAEIAFECATGGGRQHTFTGPLLHDVLMDAGPVFDPARREDRPRFRIAVHGTDGHHTLLSRAEIDPGFGRAPVLLAGTLEATPLGRAGAQLVLPRGCCGTRCIKAASTPYAWTADTPRGPDGDRGARPPGNRCRERSG